jgi:molybdopterin-guanine dinucleotide biosynthesis protein A
MTAHSEFHAQHQHQLKQGDSHRRLGKSGHKVSSPRAAVDKTSMRGKILRMLTPPVLDHATTTNNNVTGLLLAGGMGRRMGGADKGLVSLDGRPMAAWVIERLRPQVGQLLINANRNPEQWGEFSCPVIPDQIGGFAGPLAGFHAGLCACSTPLLVTAPCDSPFMPLDLVARMLAALERDGADLAVVRSSSGLQPVFALMRRELASNLEAFLAAGGRKIDLWFAQLNTVIVDFDDEDAFANINTPDELVAAQTMTL